MSFDGSTFLEEQRKREKEERELQKKKEREEKGDFVALFIFLKFIFMHLE